MEKYNKALKVAVNSYDTNLINLVIHKMMKAPWESPQVKEKTIHELFSQNAIANAHLIQYYKNFNQKQLSKYLQYSQKFNEQAIQAVK